FARGFAPDVIYYPGGHAYKPLLDLLLPRSARVVLTVHDPELHAGEDSSLHRFLDASNRLRVDGYVLLNEVQRADFVARLKLDSASVTVIPHGVLDHLVAAAASLADFEGLAQITPFAGQYALFVGRIGRYKGLGLLLSAYNALADPAPFPLIIAGSGALSPQELDLLGELRDQRVMLLNKWLADDEMATLVAAARFVVVPYVAATQSAVIPLASGFGVPSIASDAGGLVEQVLDGETGFLFPAKDGSALRSALERAFSMPDDQYSEMSAACKAFARANWDWDVLAGKLTRFFDAIR
ncbi:MAG: glycosyltransferase family 4 protein, partial [Actinomycetota bacterium]|nr:glycosyltransferase family 4 protein [Actinomycetota bacterium]